MGQYEAPTPAVALAATTAKTVLYVKAGANIGIELDEWWVEFDGVTAGNVPVEVELLRFTSDCTTTSLTPKSRGTILEGDTAYCTAGYNSSADGSAGDVLYRHNVPPTSGKHVMFPLGKEIQIGKGERFGIRCTAPNNVNCYAGFGIVE